MSIVEMEEQFNWKNMRAEIKITKKVVKKLFSSNLTIIRQISDCQTRLTGMYWKEAEMKKALSLKYEENVLMMNALLNQPYWSYAILLLVENTLYGSARVLLRQFFEALLIAKYSEYDHILIDKWKNKGGEKDPLNEIFLNRHVLKPLRLEQKPLMELEQIWNVLCDATHPTRYAQQAPRFSKTKTDIREWIIGTKLPTNIQFTLDLLFMLLCMNNHLLIGHLGKKVYRWYLGYEKDPLNTFVREKQLKEKIKKLIAQYFEANSKFKKANKMIKRNISEYRRNWS